MKKLVKKPKKVAARVKKSVAVKPIGKVTHYYGGIKVGIFKFTRPVKSGERLAVRGATTNFKFSVGSIQLNHKAIKKAPKGKQVGIKIPKKARAGDRVFEE